MNDMKETEEKNNYYIVKGIVFFLLGFCFGLVEQLLDLLK
jgi:hypothetical protein